MSDLFATWSAVPTAAGRSYRASAITKVMRTEDIHVGRSRLLPKPRLQRTRTRAPLSRKPLGERQGDSDAQR
jgi:hypothetical protein